MMETRRSHEAQKALRHLTQWYPQYNKQWLKTLPDRKLIAWYKKDLPKTVEHIYAALGLEKSEKII